MSGQPLLQVRQVSKSFPGVRALDGVCLDLSAGEVLAVVGENGAGKSTLMKILAGIYPPDAGEILLSGSPVRFATGKDALWRGICLIHQELNLVEGLSVWANFFLGREITWGGPLRLLSRRRMARECHDRLVELGLVCSPQRMIRDLPLGQRQLVEIARALAVHTRILIVDEPTSSLSQSETEGLFQVDRKGV